MKICLKRITAVLVLAALLITCLPPVPTEAAVAAPQNARFLKWDKNDFTAFSIKFTIPQAIDGAQLRVTLTNGHVELLSRNFDEYCVRGETWKHSFWNFANNHIYVVHARVYRYNSYGNAVYSAWSNPVFITPWPIKVGSSTPNKKQPYVKLKWNTIYGSSGYNVFVTTNPYGKWYWNQSTATKATATTATIKRFRGKKLKKGQKYYIKIITRRRYKGVFCTVPAPYSSYNNYRFYLK